MSTATDKVYGIGIIGCGAVSVMHIEVAKRLEGVRLVGFADYDPKRAVSFAEKHGGRAFADMEALIRDPEVDIAVICTPSGLHAEQAVAALRAGCHVLIEKPLALTEEGIRDVLTAEKETGRTVGVICQQRFSPAIAELHRLIAEGALGRLLLADLSMLYHRDPSYYEAVAWRGTKKMDGGELFNQGVHGIDILLYLCGEVTAVSGACRTLTHRIEAEDTTVAMLEFKSGAVGTVRSTTAITPGYPRRMTLCFTGGTVVIDDDKIISWDVLDVPCPEVSTDEGRAAHRDPMAFSCDYHLAETADFVDAIREGRPPLISSLEGRRAPDVILAVYRSAESGERVVL